MLGNKSVLHTLLYLLLAGSTLSFSHLAIGTYTYFLPDTYPSLILLSERARRWAIESLQVTELYHKGAAVSHIAMMTCHMQLLPAWMMEDPPPSLCSVCATKTRRERRR